MFCVRLQSWFSSYSNKVCECLLNRKIHKYRVEPRNSAHIGDQETLPYCRVLLYFASHNYQKSRICELKMCVNTRFCAILPNAVVSFHLPLKKKPVQHYGTVVNSNSRLIGSREKSRIRNSSRLFSG